MKKYLVTIALIATILLGSLGILSGCQEGLVTETPGAQAVFDNLKLRGGLYVYDTSEGKYEYMLLPSDPGATIVSTTGTQTLTNKTLTSPSVTSPTIAAATITGTVTIANGCTLTTPSMSSPTITGVPVNANVEMGSVNITAGNAASASTAHSLGSTPTICVATWQADPGGDGSLWFSTTNSTHIVISATANSSNNCAIDYILYISGE